jgi:hypothetical protein
MTSLYKCDEKERLVAYLYGETGDRERALIEAHLATCPPCADEVEGLRAVREDLATWQSPASELGFRIVREPAAAETRRWWQVPVWVPTAMAAGLVLAMAAAAANIRIEYGPGVVTIRSGAPVQTAQAQPAAAPAARQAQAPAGIQPAQFEAALGALEQRLRSEMATIRSSVSGGDTTRTASAESPDRPVLLQQVQELIDASERRQQRELALRLAQVVQDVDTQRRTDMVRIENGFGQIEGLTGQEAARQRQLINHLMRTSQQR